MQIITGKTGEAHVRAEDDRALHAGMIGTSAYILPVGSRLAASIETANNIVIADGELIFQGTHARIRYGETDTCIIENGTTGYNRLDLIVARYKQVAGLESVTLEVLKGDPTTATPTAPAYTPGNILQGDTLAEIPLYEVRISGVNVVSVTCQLPVLLTCMDNLYTKAEIDQQNGQLNTKIDQVNAQAAASLTQNVAALDAKINSNQQSTANQLASLSSGIDTVEKRLQEQVDRLDAADATTLSAIDAKVAAEAGARSAGDEAASQAAIAHANNLNTNIQAQISSLQSQINSIKTTCESLQKQINALKK